LEFEYHTVKLLKMDVAQLEAQAKERNAAALMLLGVSSRDGDRAGCRARVSMHG
jgi:hypothetical protein